MAARDYAKRPLEDFLQELGSATVSPGGGSAAALTAASGIALVEMTARLNAKRDQKKNGRVPSDAAKRIQKLDTLRKQAAELVTRDVKVFLKLSNALKKGKDSATFQSAAKAGAETPLHICELSVEAMAIGLKEIPRTSAWLASDLAEAGVLLETALEAASFNVRINLKDITDKNYAQKTAARLASLKKDAVAHGRRLQEVLI